MREFAAFVAAVTPAQRRENKYKILVAMYVLSADRNAVPARAIENLIRLHMPSGVPANIRKLLRDYAGLVSPSGQSPILWQLTDGGVEYLRLRSGFALAASAAGHESDIGLICALEDPEFTAVMNAFGGPGAWSEISDPRYPHLYRETQLDVDGKFLKVVGVTATSMGLTSAAIATTHLVFRFRPRLVCMIGIAAGTRGGAKEFGDVLVADPSVDYNSGKIVEEDGVRTLLPDPYPIGINPRLRALLGRYKNNPDVFANIRSRWNGSLPGSRNRIHVGALGAADQVIDDPARIIEIQRSWRKLVGVEMESYAVYRACEEAPEPQPRFCAFKSICDFASEKSDTWQEFAAFVAAEFAAHFLKSEWERLWTHST